VCGVSERRWVLANGQVRVGVIPVLGAKVDSLVHLPTGREWLLAPAGSLPERHEYGSEFTGTVLCGWDEMLPTIDPCRYPAEPYADVELPDHGEAWALPWQTVQFSATSVTCAVEGRALPYRLRRSVSLDGPAVTMSYKLEVVGDAELALLWSPHPQFTVRPGTTLRLPATVGQLTAVVQAPHGDSVRRIPVGPSGLDCTRIVPAGQDMMLYLQPEARASWAELRDPDGCWLRMSWDSEHLPYLAVWMDHGRYSPAVVCPEPMTGFYDHLGRAYHDGKILVVAPGRPAQWSIRVTLGGRSCR
jgi:galactose mutarotase-like enzyme